MKPVYGLAEIEPVRHRAAARPRAARRSPRRAAFERARAIEPAAPDDPQPLTFVACGRPLPRHEVRIVDDAGRRSPARVEGRIEFRGPSVDAGLLPQRRSHRGGPVRDGGWIDTGDLGYWATTAISSSPAA